MGRLSWTIWLGPVQSQEFLKVEWGGRRKLSATMKQCELDSTLNCWLREWKRILSQEMQAVSEAGKARKGILHYNLQKRTQSC